MKSPIVKNCLTVFVTDVSLHPVSLAIQAVSDDCQWLWLPEHLGTLVQRGNTWPRTVDRQILQY